MMAAIAGEDLIKLGIQINPLDARNSTNNIQGSSYDFRVGEEIWLWSKRDIFHPREGEVILRRNDIAVIKTYETIKMPADVCGIVVNKVASHAMGVYHPATSIDPLFDGHMHVALINVGRYDIPLKFQDDLCTAIFFTMTNPTQIHHKRTQDFSQLIQVFAENLHIMYPERAEEIPLEISLGKLEEEIVWRGNPFISIYSFLAVHDRQLADLRRSVRGYFILIMAGPWLLAILALGVIAASAHLSWTQIQPAATILGVVNAVVNLTILVFRWFRGKKLK
jgi:deoxycytidine triphosphate deaminase